jgi:hypothetical protein
MVTITESAVTVVEMPSMRLVPLAFTAAPLLEAHPPNHAIRTISGMISRKNFRREKFSSGGELVNHL